MNAKEVSGARSNIMEEEIISEVSAMEDAKTKDKKTKNLIAAVILLGGLFLGSVFVDIAQLVKGNGYSERVLKKTDVFEAAGKTWVAYSEPIVKINVLTDDNCEECNPKETLILIRRVLPTISVSKITNDSEEGEKILTDFKIRSLPAFVFSKEIANTEFFSETQQLFEKINDEYLLRTAEAGIKIGKYLELPKIEEGDIKIGPNDAKVKIVEFSDFQCPYCQKFHSEMNKVINEYGDKIQFVYKHLPLDFHPQANNAALAAECANEQGKFRPYADKLFQDQEKWGKTEGIQGFKNIAGQLGLNISQFSKCLEEAKYQEKIANNSAEAASFGISGTPGTFINDQFLGGASDFETMKEMIDHELTK